MIRSRLSTLLLLAALAVLPITTWAGATLPVHLLESAASTVSVPKSLQPFVPYRHVWLGAAANDDTWAVRIGDYVTFTKASDYQSRHTALAYVLEDGGRASAVVNGKNIDKAIFGSSRSTQKTHLQSDDWTRFCKDDKGAVLRMQGFVDKASRSKQFDYHSGQNLAGDVLKKLLELCKAKAETPPPSDAAHLQAYIRVMVRTGNVDNWKADKNWRNHQSLEEEDLPSSSYPSSAEFRAADPAGHLQVDQMFRTMRAELSKREYEAMELVIKGYSYREIAERLKVSVPYAKELVHDARGKLINSQTFLFEAPAWMTARYAQSVDAY